MTRNRSVNGELRSSFAERGIRNARRYVPTGSAGVFIQVTQAIIFMYLIFIGYTVMGLVGVIAVSVLFLLALLSPFIFELLRSRASRRARTAPESRLADREVNQEG